LWASTRGGELTLGLSRRGSFFEKKKKILTGKALGPRAGRVVVTGSPKNGYQ